MSKHDALDDLLRHAPPRPVPAAADMAAAKAAVRDEWRRATGRRIVRRRVMQLALAASVVLAAFVALNTVKAPVGSAVTVATIAKSTGPIYVLGESAELRPSDDLDTIVAGQTIVTGNDAGLALRWGNGGSVRIDENTRIRFDTDAAVFVEEGRIYFDSIDAWSAVAAEEGEPQFTLRTELASLQHLGTQYMAEVDHEVLIVSVREGSVAVDGRVFDETITAGQQATWQGQQRPSILGIARSGPAWAWLARTTPPADVDGKTLFEFLSWACREMGLELRFEGEAERISHEAILRGTIDAWPEEALRLRLATAALEWRIEGDVIYISND